MNNDYINIIDQLIKRRKLKGWTQEELAQATHLTQSVIARLERKKVIPKLDTLLKIVFALGCSLEVLPNETL